MTLSPIIAPLFDTQTFTKQESFSDNSFGYFFYLPIEIIEHIFSFISLDEGGRLFAVCRLFNEIANKYFDPSIQDQIWIKRACLRGRIEIVKRLLKHPKIDPSVDNNYAIKAASMGGYKEVVEELLKDPRVDPSAVNESIEVIIKIGHTETVKVLLQHPKVNPFVENNIIQTALNYEHYNIALALLSHSKLHLSEEAQGLCNSAVRSGLTKAIEILLQYPKIESLVNLQELFLQAVIQNENEIAKIFLMDERIDPCSKDNKAFKLANSKMKTELVKDERIKKKLENTKNDNSKSKCFIS